VPLDSAVNIDFPYIVRRFDLPIPMIQWIVISYVLTQTSLLLSFGRMGDILGYRRIFLFGTGISAVAFVACAVAPSYAWLLAGRVAQGIGAGLILSVGPALATGLFPEEQRARVLGHYMMMFGLGGALGPAVFGLLLERFGWSAVFGFRAPLAAAAFGLAWTLPKSPRADRAETFDAVGGALLAVALSFFLLALNRSREPASFIVCALVCVACFVLFARRQTRALKPIINMTLFRNGTFNLINLAFALSNLALFSIMLLSPFYLSNVAHLSAPVAGMVLATSPLGIMLCAPLAGRVVAAGRSPWLVAACGMAATALGLGGVSLAGENPAIPLLAASMFIAGAGMGLFQVSYFDILTAAIPQRDRGVAGALGMATRSIGTVTGATVLMLVFQLRQASQGLVPALQLSFMVAAAIPAVLAVAVLLRRPGLRVRSAEAASRKP
jgi:MFS family permease